MRLIQPKTAGALEHHAAETATRLTGCLVDQAMRGEPDEKSQQSLGRVAMIVKASRYLTPAETDELVTYLQLL